MRYAAPLFADSAKAAYGRRLLSLFVGLAVLLVLAPPANADRGIVGSYQFNRDFPENNKPGSFGGLTAGAINETGAGGASAGDLYLSDLGSGNRPRFQVFGESGDFKRLWGADVVESGPGNSDESQLLIIQATGGSFTVTFGGETTGPIAATASATTVQAALDSLSSVIDGAVTVSGGPGDAAGSNPYLVVFDGPMGQINQPLMQLDASALSGGPETGWVATINAGAEGFEICQTANGDNCKQASVWFQGDVANGAPANTEAFEINQQTGDVYIATKNSIYVYSAMGEFIKAWGKDVVSSGGDDSTVDEQQELTVKADGGTFTLTYPANSTLSETAGPIPYNASASTVQAALNNLDALRTDTGRLDGGGGYVTVTGGPGDLTGSTPYVVEFHGALGGDDVSPILATDTGLTISSGTKSATVETLVNGGGNEVCEAGRDVCQEGSPGGEAGALQSPQNLTIAPPTASNAGNVIVADAGNSRVDEFTASGEFVRAFGWSVTASGPGDTGAADDQQQITLGGNTTGGKFALRFAGENFTPPTTGAVGGGNVVSGSTTVSDVTVNGGAFAIGQVITATYFVLGEPEPAFPTGTTVVGVGPNTLTVSNPALVTTPVGLVGSDLAFDAPASQVEAALNALPTIGGVGGSVTVTGGPGPGTPYTVTFGGTLGGTDEPEIITFPGGLSTSGGAPSVTTTTTTQGGGFEVCIPSAGDVCESGAVGDALGQFGGLMSVAADSTGAIYTADSGASGRVQKFTPSGGLDLTPSEIGSDEMQTVTVNANAGDFRLAFGSQRGATVGEGNGTAGSNLITNVTTSKGEFTVGQAIRVGSSALPSDKETFITAVGPDTLTLSRPIQFFSERFTFSSDLPELTPSMPYSTPAQGPGSLQDALNALPSIGGAGNSVEVVGGPGSYEVTFNGGDFEKADVIPLDAFEGNTPLSGGVGPGANEVTISTPSPGGPNGISNGDAPVAVSIAPNDDLFVLRKFLPRAGVCPDGVPSPAEQRIQELTPVGDVVDVSVPCTEIDSDPIFSTRHAGLFVNAGTGQPYVAWEGEKPSVFVFDEEGPSPTLTLNPPSNVSPAGASISGTINPNGPGPVIAPFPSATTYTVEFKKHSDPESAWSVFAPAVSVGTGLSDVSFNIGLGGLEPKTEYDTRVVVDKPYVAHLVGAVQTFTTTAAPPVIEAFSSRNVTASSADLTAQINPRGTETTYHFEYGTTLDFGHATPEVNIGDSLSGVSVEDHIEDLESSAYFFRVVASNALGTVVSTPQTFNFYPEACPNSNVRQQTGSGNLPDCRAYELVSPGEAGGATLETGGPNSPLATNPSRFAFVTLFGSIPGPWDPPNVLADQYVATRTTTGWKTQYIGVPGDVAGRWGGTPNREGSTVVTGSGSLSMDKFVGWTYGLQGVSSSLIGSMAGYAYDADGNSLGRWPTVASQIPGGLDDLTEGAFVGDVRLSGDFSHYFFSSANVAFTPDGLIEGSGSAYDNDLETGTVTKISVLSNGQDIPEEPGDHADDWLRIPAASSDGSRVLLAAAGTGLCGNPTCAPLPSICGFEVPCPRSLPSHLYMREDNEFTYDVSRGHLVTFSDMTDDGSKVFYTSADQITSDDHDTSIDLYMWSAETDSVVRVSKGTGGVGDTDACNPGWIPKCGVEVVPANNNLSLFKARLSPSTDNAVAGGTGDVYFYSPEQFVGAEGIPGRRNLYVSRQGEIQFVATLDADKGATRIQVSSDGDHAAFISTSRLTSYDNDGFSEMYAYDAVSEELRCVSCAANGDAPTSDVVGSMDGLFMSDDGRTFFATTDALVSSDSNGLLDVYEYVNGRAQLISSGIGVDDNETGLVGVSANGVDVYFATRETFVPEDRNGRFLKFYDARTGGGFAQVAQVAPCAAADECHGEDTPGAAAVPIASGAQLGAGGNARAPRRCKARTKRAHKKKAKRRCRGAKHATTKRGAGS